MKNAISIILLLIVTQICAQSGNGMFSKDPLLNLENWDKQRMYYGYFLGFNSYDYKIDYKTNTNTIKQTGTTGFNVGLIGNLRIHEYFDLRFEPGLYYANRTLTYPNFTTPRDAIREIKSTYLHFPLLVKYSSLRTGNIRPFLVGGASSTLNLSSNSNTKDDNEQQRFRVKPWTYNYELGLGIDLYFEYFKFSPSIRGVFGIGDELIRDNDPNSPWTSNIDSFKSRAVLVNFSFH